MPTNAELKKLVDEQDAAITDLKDAQDATNDKLDLILKAINNPVVKTTQHGYEVDIDPVEGVAQFADDDTPGDHADGTPDLIETNVTEINSQEFQDKADTLRFMNEMVVVYIQETAEPDADDQFFIGVNGQQVAFVRGQRYQIKRYILEGLARCRPVHYSNEEYREGNIDKVRWPSRRGVRYPFQVVEDKNPAGQEWLRRVMLEP